MTVGSISSSSQQTNGAAPVTFIGRDGKARNIDQHIATYNTDELIACGPGGLHNPYPESRGILCRLCSWIASIFDRFKSCFCQRGSTSSGQVQQAKELINDYLRTPSCAKKRVVVIQGASHRTVGIVSQSLTEAENVELDRKLSEVASATGSLKIHVFGLSKEGASISVSLRSGEVMCNGEKVLHRQASGIGRFSAEQLDRMVIFTEAWGKAVIPDTDPQKQRMIEDITGCFSERV